MRLMLDSAFVIDLFNGHEGAAARHEAIFESGDEAMINEIVVCEVRAGMRSSEAWLLHTFLEPIEFLQPGPESAVRAGVWREDARARGRHLALADALIAAAAEAVGGAVLTRNVKDFALTPVRIETY